MVVQMTCATFSVLPNSRAPILTTCAILLFGVSLTLLVVWYRIRTRSLGAKPQDLLEQRTTQQQEQAA